jgi:hypothetical protein
MGNRAYAPGIFALLFILLLVWVDPSLLYFQNDFSNSYPICLDDGSIFGKTPSYPGMPADYLSARIGGFFFIPWVAAATAIALLVGTLVYGLDAVNAFACTVPRSSLIAGVPPPATLFSYGAFLVFPALAVFGLTRSMPKQEGARGSGIAFRGGALPQRLGGTLVCIGAFTLVVLIGSDDTTGKQLRIRRCAELGQWREAIAQARRLAPDRFNELVSHDVNVALFREDRLLSEFFSFPQNSYTLMLDDPALPPVVVNRMMMGPYFDLGHLNMAEYQALETEELSGGSPPARRLLAMIYLAKGRIETARVYLHSLQGDPRYGAWARERLALARSDSVVALDEEVRRARSLAVTSSTVLNQGSSDDYLAQALERNGKNRMAVEFSIMRALLRGDSEAPLRYLDALESCGYVRDTLPRHCEEAILLHEALTQKTPDLKGWRISDASTQRCGEFISLMAQSTAMDHAALQSLRARFGDTYWYYWLSLQRKVVAE